MNCKSQRVSAATFVAAIGAAAILMLGGCSSDSDTPPVSSGGTTNFYVYHDQDSALNKFFPGVFEDGSDLAINYGVTGVDGTGIRITYAAAVTTGTDAAGIFWQNPAENWGDLPGGYNLSGYSTLSFYARGAVGGERIRVGMGGNTSGSAAGDSGASGLFTKVLTDEWARYTVDLDGVDRSYIIGGFLLYIQKSSNPSGATFYLDEIRYEP